MSAYTEEVTTKKARARDLTERQAETLRTVIRERIEMLIPAEIDRAELLGINQGGLNRFMDRKQGGSFGVALRVAAMLDQDIMDMLAIEHTETRFAIDTEAIEEHAALPLIARAAAFESFTAEQVNYAIAQRKRAGALKTVRDWFAWIKKCAKEQQAALRAQRAPVANDESEVLMAAHGGLTHEARAAHERSLADVAKGKARGAKPQRGADTAPKRR